MSAICRDIAMGMYITSLEGCLPGANSLKKENWIACERNCRKFPSYNLKFCDSLKFNRGQRKILWTYETKCV